MRQHEDSECEYHPDKLREKQQAKQREFELEREALFKEQETIERLELLSDKRKRSLVLREMQEELDLTSREERLPTLPLEITL